MWTAIDRRNGAIASREVAIAGIAEAMVGIAIGSDFGGGVIGICRLRFVGVGGVGRSGLNGGMRSVLDQNHNLFSSGVSLVNFLGVTHLYLDNRLLGRLRRFI